MTNERLEQIRDSIDFQLSAEKNLKIDKEIILEEKELLDCITKLQEEIKRQSKAQVILDNQIAEMFKYKSRNEKAIEYMKNAGCYEEDTKIFCTDIYGDELINLLNILGGDEE